jgi:hypothetical protein
MKNDRSVQTKKDEGTSNDDHSCSHKYRTSPVTVTAVHSCRSSRLLLTTIVNHYLFRVITSVITLFSLKMENPQEVNEGSESSSAAAVRFSEEQTSKLCLKCKAHPMTYECSPCGCPSFCTDCARKFATGGRCKTCGEMYGELRRLQK